MTSTNNFNSNIGIDLSKLEKDIRGLIFKIVNEEMQKFNVKSHIEKTIANYMKKSIDKTAKKYVYAFLEKSEITYPDPNVVPYNPKYEKKIVLNTFIIQIIREVITNRVVTELGKINITIIDEKNEKDRRKNSEAKKNP